MILMSEKIKQLADKYSDENNVIIKRKNDKVDFIIHIKHGFNQRDVHFNISLDELTIDSKLISMFDIKSIYIKSINYKSFETLYLYIKNFENKKIIKMDITGLSDEDTAKLSNFFEFFIFSNEKDTQKLKSKLYIPVLKESSQDFSFNLNNYKDKKILQDEIIKKDHIDYILFKILPKSYYNNYNKSNNMLFYESKYLNDCYMDIWVDKEWLENSTKYKEIKKIIYSILLFIISIISILMIVYIYTIVPNISLGMVALMVIIIISVIEYIMIYHIK